MPKPCKACGTENRDEAKFCRSCGAPLKKKKENRMRTKEQQDKIKKFWTGLGIIFALAAATGYVVVQKVEFYGKVNVLKKYIAKYENVDDRVFGTVKPAEFTLESLWWNMSPADIKMVYPYAAAGNDPDFVSSFTVVQNDMKVKIPHANFMSLGVADGRLYAVKFEFGATEEAQRQQLKVPHKEIIMYGRFRGLLKVFREVYGDPVIEKNDVKSMDLTGRIKTVKKGVLKSGAPSNIYYAWIVGRTKVELVLFGNGKKMHLTLRFLYLPVWEKIGEK